MYMLGIVKVVQQGSADAGCPATGDLAKKKIYPALFALYVEGHLPEDFCIFGYARSKMSDAEFRTYIAGSLSCRLSDKDSCGGKFDAFLERCFYQPGQYAEEADFRALSDRMAELEQVCFLNDYSRMPGIGLLQTPS
jgi:glucose-6-phosphate 1-dehydrogenase